MGENYTTGVRRFIYLKREKTFVENIELSYIFLA